MSKNVIYVNNIARPKARFFSAEITEEFIQTMKGLFWTIITCLFIASAIVVTYMVIIATREPIELRNDPSVCYATLKGCNY